MTTHWIPPFTNLRGKGAHVEQAAICGRWVTEREYSTEPTCPECIAYLSDAAATDDPFGDGGGGAPVPARPEPDVRQQYEQTYSRRFR